MGGHALRGMVTAWLGLVVLQTVSTKGGSGRVAGLFTDLDNLVQRALNPTIPAIPDRRAGAGSSTAGAAQATPYTRTLPVPAPTTYPTTLGRVGGVFAN